MKPDPILAELWQVKDRLAEEAGNDPTRFIENLSRWEAEHIKKDDRKPRAERVHRSS